LLFDVGGIEQLAEAIGRLAANGRLRSELARRGRRIVRKNYSATSMAEKYETLYRALYKNGMSA
ncbi:MAG: hypothetical protein O7G31_13495, partial [Calditrichaeota bacterium]|nr:hypothetical protein [Calditrichota bacterium]